MSRPQRGAALVITHDDRGRPDITIETRQPTRYDVPASGPVPAEPERGAQGISLRIHSDGHSGARLVISGEFAYLVAIIDRADFGTWAEQIGHLADRIRSGL